MVSAEYNIVRPVWMSLWGGQGFLKVTVRTNSKYDLGFLSNQGRYFTLCSLDGVHSNRSFYKARNEATANLSRNQIFTFHKGCVRSLLNWFVGHRAMSDGKRHLVSLLCYSFLWPPGSSWISVLLPLALSFPPDMSWGSACPVANPLLILCAEWKKWWERRRRGGGDCL